jgi:DNA repair ATPase RecN
MSEYLNMAIGYQVESTAEWRRVKAQQFPDDRRNVRAAEELEDLAAQIDRIGEAEPIHQQIAKLDDTLNAMDNCDDAWLHITEAVEEELRSIGFHSSYESGLQFLEWYRDLVQEQIDELLNEDVPVSSLDEPDDRARIRAQALGVALAACEVLATFRLL